VISPHATFFTTEAGTVQKDAAGPRLALSVKRTRNFRPEEIGRMAEVLAVASATREALAELGLSEGSAVHYVQVKGPLLTPAGIKDAGQRGVQVVTTDPNLSKSYARGATALGVALGLGELAEHQVTEQAITSDLDLYSEVASTSAGGELSACEVLVFANSPLAGGEYRIGHSLLRDPIDVAGVRSALRSAGLTFDCEPDADQRARIVAVFAKAEAPRDGELAGRRTTMLSDADINYERHARAAVGGVIASVTGDPAIFVSGGSEHQGPPGQAPIAAIVRC
jgi:cyanuric acid amidohydrolase